MKSILAVILTVLFYADSCFADSFMLNDKAQLISEINYAISNSDSLGKSALLQYLSNVETLEADGVSTLRDILKFYQKYSISTMDTLTYTVGDFDGNGHLDTFITRIQNVNDTVKCKTVLHINDTDAAEFSYNDPYSYIDSSSIFNVENKDIWIRFYLAVTYGIVQKLTHDEFKIDDNCTSIATQYLEKSKANFNKYELTKYLKSFSGDYVALGEPEGRDLLYVWYSPIQKFIVLYSP